MTTTSLRKRSGIRAPAVPPRARAWLWRYLPLPIVVILGTAFAARWALDVDEWRVMTDEMLYVKLAVSISESLSPLPELRGQRVDNYSLLYPLFLSPLVGFFDMPTAFRLAHALNAFLMASTAVPAYLMARMAFDSRRLALLVGALAAAVPWIALSLSLMTEALAYPAFAWSSYAIARAVARPGVGGDASALVAIALASLTRAQFIFLAAVFPLAVVLHELGIRLAAVTARRWPRCLGPALAASVRGHWVLFLLTAIGVGAAIVGSPRSVLGPYGGTVDGPLFPPGTLDALFEHVNQVAVGIGIIPLPLAVLWVVQTIYRPSSRAAHALAVSILLLVPAVALVGTRFGVLFVGAVQERYVFYMVPLLFVGAMAWLVHVRKATAALATAAVGTVFLVTQSTYAPVGGFPVFSSPVPFTFVALDFRTKQLSDLLGFSLSPAAALAVATVTVLVGIAALFRTRWRSVVPAVVGIGLLAWCVAVTSYAAPKVKEEHESMASANLGERPLATRDWVDQAVPNDASVAFVPSPINARGGAPHPRGTAVEQSVWWEVEFWNKTVDREYLYGEAPGYAPFPEGEMTLEPRSGQLEVTDPEADYLVLAQTNVRLAPDAIGKPVLYGDLALYRPRRPYRAAWATTAVYDDGTVGTGQADLHLYGSRGTASTLRRISLLLAPSETGASSRYRIGGAGLDLRGQLRSVREVSFRACVPARGRRSFRITAPPGGTRVLKIEVETLRAPCPASPRSASAGH